MLGNPFGQKPAKKGRNSKRVRRRVFFFTTGSGRFGADGINDGEGPGRLSLSNGHKVRGLPPGRKVHAGRVHRNNPFSYKLFDPNHTP